MPDTTVRYLILYDPQKKETVEDDLLPLFEEAACRHVPYQAGQWPEVNEGEVVITFLSDTDIAILLSEALERKWVLGFLPHPEMNAVRAGLGISGKYKEAVADICDRPESVKVDLLRCNDKPVFNSVMIGTTLSLVSGQSPTAQNKWERLGALWRDLRNLTPAAYGIEYEEEKKIETAAVGIVVVQHGRSTRLSRRVLDTSHANDGFLHALVLAPRSLSGAAGFILRSLWEGNEAKAKLPYFVGHLKTRKLQISSPKPIEFSVDGLLLAAKEITFAVEPEVLHVMPGRYLDMDPEPKGARASFRINKLPRGETRELLLSKPLPWIYHASKDEFKELFKTLRGNAQTKSSYLVLMMLSTLMATFGLFANSSPVIIGAMILAPLMAPIISLGMGALRQDRSLSVQSLKTIGSGLALALVVAVVTTLLTPLREMNSEIAMRVRPNLLDLGVAIAAGVAGAYAHAREEVAQTLAGVAIAVALVPPLAVAGIGLGWLEWEIFGGASLLLLTNFVGMVLAAAITFLLLGFSPFELARRGLLISLVLVVLVSIPLGYMFVQTVEKDRVSRTLTDWEVEGLHLRSVKVQETNPLHLSLQVVSPKKVDDQELDQLKKAIEEKLGRSVTIEVTVATVR